MKMVVGSGEQGYLLDVLATGLVRVVAETNVSNYIYMDSTSSVNDNKWHYVVGYKSGSTVKVFIDGIDRSGTQTTLGSVGSTSTSQTLKIGYPSFAGPTYWNGFIDEPKIYPYARSAAQIKADYNARGSVQGTAVSMGQANAKSLSDGLVGYWKMDESNWSGGANEVVDASGNANHGVRSGDATTIVGKYGNGGTFDGTGDYVTFANTAFSASAPWSTSFWIYSNAVKSTIPLCQQTSSSYIRTYFNGASSSIGVRNTAGDTETAVTVNMSTSTWYHITATADGAGLAKIYLNGDYVGTSNPGASGTAIALSIFGKGYPNDSFSLNGKMDELRIYNRGLSPAEVQQLYNFAPNPVGHWKLDEGTGQQPNDSSGNGLTGTLGATTGSSTDDPAWISAKYGKGLSFDGDDFASFGDALDSTFASSGKNFTISTWIKPATTMTSNVIFTKNADSRCSPGENQRQFSLRLFTGSKVEFFWYGALDASVYRGALGSTAITDTSKWYHVTATYDSSQTADNKVSLYVDGVKETTTIDLTAGSPTNIVDGTAHLAIGSRVSSTGTACD